MYLYAIALPYKSPRSGSFRPLLNYLIPFFIRVRDQKQNQAWLRERSTPHSSNIPHFEGATWFKSDIDFNLSFALLPLCAQSSLRPTMESVFNAASLRVYVPETSAIPETIFGSARSKEQINEDWEKTRDGTERDVAFFGELIPASPATGERHC